MDCTLNNSIYKSGNYTDSDALLLTLATNTPIFAKWYGNKPIELINDEFINDNNERISAAQLLNNINSKKDDLLYQDKPDDYLGNVIAQLIGIEPFEDEVDNGIITERELILNQSLRSLLNNFTEIIYDENNNAIHGDNFINLAHLSVNDSFLMYYPAFIIDEDSNLVDSILNDIDNTVDNWIDKKIIVSNLLMDYINLPLKTQRKLFKLATNISNRIGITDKILSPNQEVMSFLEGLRDVETLSGLDYLVNKNKYREEINNEYKENIISPFRKIIFTVILDNLKEKFGVNYKWVKGDNTFHARLVNGIVEINENNFNDETPFHEYLHPIVMTLKIDNIDLYNQLVSNSNVRQLTNELSQIEEYKDDAEEEALVRHLSNNFKELTFTVGFQQFWIWLKNLMKRLFKVNSEKLNLSSDINDITDLMLNAHKYDTSSFKLHPRYSFNRYELAKVVMKKSPTNEQKDVMANLAKIQNRIEDYDISIEKEHYKLTHKETGDVILLKRVTSIKFFDYKGTNESAIIGEFLHDLFTHYLRLRNAGKDFNQDGDGFIKPLVITPGKKNKEITYLGYKNKNDGFTDEYTNKKIPAWQNGLYSQIDEKYVNSIEKNNPFTHYILKNIMFPEDTNDEKREVLQQIYRNINDQDIFYLYQMMANMEKHIVDTVNNVEKVNIKLEDLILYNEMFIHNFVDDTSIIANQLYGGTLDIFVISPSGRKYNFDIKTAGSSKIGQTNEKLIDAASKIYSTQQSAYRELISFITEDGENLASDIETYIIHMPRGVDYIYKEETFTKIVNDLIDIINSPFINYDEISDLFKSFNLEKDDLIEMLENSITFFGDKNSADFKAVDGILKGIQFQDVSHTTDKNINVKFLSKVIEIYNNNFDEANKYKIPPHDNNVLKYERILNTETNMLNIDEISRIIPIEYNRKVLSDADVKILNEISYHPFVIELNEMIDLIRKKIFNFREMLKKLDKNDDEMKIIIDDINHEIEALNAYKVAIAVELIKIFNNNSIDEDNINNIKNRIYSDDWNFFKRLLHKQTTGDVNFIEYRREAQKLKQYIDKSKIDLSNIKKAHEQDIKVLEKKGAKLYAEIQRLLSTTNISFIQNQSTLNIDDDTINNLNKQLMAIYIKIDKLKEDNKLLTIHINKIDLNSRVLNQHIIELKEKNNISIILRDAEFHYEKIVNLITEMSNTEIPLNVRAGYYTYITKTVELYKDIANKLPQTSSQLSDIAQRTLNIQTKYEKLLKEGEHININNLFKIIAADLINTHREEGINLIQNKHLIETTLTEYKMWQEKMTTLYTAYIDEIRSFVDDNIDSFESSLSIAGESLKNYYITKRNEVMSRIDEELKFKGGAAGVNWLRENFLPASRSNYVLVQIFSVLESEINLEYANKYKEVSEDIQTMFAILIGKYNNKITNRLKFKGVTLDQENYVVFENIIAHKINPNLNISRDSSLDYLTSTIDKKYQYEYIFNAKEIKDLEGLSIEQKKNYIIINGLIDKYKVIKTMRLIDKVEYGYMDTFKELKDTIRYFSKNVREKPNYRRYNMPKLKDSIVNFLKVKKDNTIQYNAINFHFIYYLRHIQEFVGMMNNIKIYNTDNIISVSELAFINDMLDNLSNANEPINMQQFKALFQDSDTIIGQSIFNAISNINDEFILINDIDTILKEQELITLKSRYGDNYGNIFYVEGLDNFAKFYGKQSIAEDDSERSIKESSFNQIKSINEAELEEKLNELRSRGGTISIAKEQELRDRWELKKQNSELLYLMKYSPFNYILSVNNADNENVTDLFTSYKVEEIHKARGQQLNIEDYSMLNLPEGNMNISENGNENHFDERWNIMEDPQHKELFDFYTYYRETLKYLYSIVPASEKSFATDLDIPFMDNQTAFQLMEEMSKKGIDFSKIKDFLNHEFYQRITSAEQNVNAEPSVMMKPVNVKRIEELYHISDKANYQLHTVLQMLAYNTLLFKTRTDKKPLHNIILNMAQNSANDEVKNGAKFANHVNMTGTIQRTINKDGASYLSQREKIEIEKLNALINQYEQQKSDLEDERKIAFDNKQYDEIDDINLELNQVMFKLVYYKRQRKAILNGAKFDKMDLTRTLINAARLVQLTYSLPGQVGNYINGMLQASVVASGSDEEMEAYKESFKILNGLLFENKLLLGGAFAGNMVTSSLLGTAAGIISIPIWLAMGQYGLDKYKNLDWLKSRFNDKVKQALNMERNYNLTFDIVEQARVGQPETQLKKWSKTEQRVVDTSNDFIEIMKPFGYIKRAEKLIAIQNMIIQSMMTKVKIKDKVLTFWELHDEHGIIKPEYSPYVSEDFKKSWQRQTEDRMHRANGNYTSKYQAENYWWGKLFFVYSKWIPEIANNYWGGYTDESQNIFSGKAHEGIMWSTGKKVIELYYNILKGKMIVDFNHPEGERIEDTTNVIIYRNGTIIKSSTKRTEFIDEYNKIVKQLENGNDTISSTALSDLVKKYNIKMLSEITPEEKQDMFIKFKDIAISFLMPFDFMESFKQRTLTRNVSGRLEKVFNNNNLTGYHKVQYANLRRFYNIMHIAYSMYFTKTLLMIFLGMLTKVFDLDDDEKYIRQLTFVVNRYNQMWEDITYFNNPVSAFYDYFHNSMSTVKFMLDIMTLNKDIAAIFPHAINGLLGDSEIGELTLEAMGFKDPVLEKSKGITNIKPINDFVDMIPLFNKLVSIHKQSTNDYSNTED